MSVSNLDAGSGAPSGAASACVIIPMYNESRVVAAVVRQVREAFDMVVCVDDGSRDQSADKAHRAGAIVIRHPLNMGQGAALRTGIDYALSIPTVRHIVTFDADGQHDVRDAANMLGHARGAGIDVVLGSRFLGSASQTPGGRRRLLRLALAFTRLTTRLPVTDTHNGLRVFSRSAAQRMKLEQTGMAHASEILALIAHHRLVFAELPVSISYTDHSRRKGQSNLNAVNILHELMTAKLRFAR